MNTDAESFPIKMEQGKWTLEEIFFSGKDFFHSLERSIAEAKSTIDMEAYIYEDDSLGRRLAESLLQAHSRGVRVRLIVDGIGSRAWQHTVAPKLMKRGIEIKIFRPLPGIGPLAVELKSHGPLVLTKVLQDMNHRNHRKLCLIDSSRAYLGSMNISAKHMGMGPAPAWRDTGVAVEGPEISILQASFEKIWSRKLSANMWKEKFDDRKGKRASASSLVRLNTTSWQRRKTYKEFLRKLEKAQRRVWITAAYFVPRTSLIRVLKEAAERGLDVRLLLPGASDVFFMPWVQSTFYQTLLNSGVRIFEYQPSVLHAKSIQIDDWALVGSSNLNHRSLLHDLEVAVALTHPETLQRMESQFHRDESQSREIRHEEWEKAAWLRKNLGQSLMFLRNWF